MKKYCIVTIVALVVMFGMQTLYIQSLYHNYRKERIGNVEDSLYVAMDDERHWRARIFSGRKPEKQHALRYKFRSDMSPAEIDSLGRVDTDTIVMDDARGRRMGKTSSDVIVQLVQEELMRKGYPLQLRVLDSLFGAKMKGRVPYRLSLLDNRKMVTATAGRLDKEADYVYPLFPIGTRGMQSIRLEIQIPVWEFMASHVLVMAISLLLMLTGLGCVLYQLLIIRRKDYLLKKREQAINGTIHDLKAPLNSVVTALSWLKVEGMNPAMGKAVEICRKEVKQMVYNIESLLVTVRKDRNRLVLRKEDVDIAALVWDAKESIELLYAGKPHEVQVISLLPEGFRILADRMYIGNVIRNLLDNALKYADDGVKVTVRLSVEKGDWLQISVSDTGWGIAPAYRKKVFEQFFQVPRGKERTRRGYGIGLAQCKYIVEEHRGSIGLESEEGKGSKFWFTLPIKQK